ncbi:MAG TPA: ABC transporter permease [Acidimicrobiia bacterium]
MRLRENLRFALAGILANRLRSALTMLGILIGVGAVILLVAVGTGSSHNVQEQIQSLGTNTLTVFRGGGFGGAGGRARNGTQSRGNQLTLKDVKALQNQQNAPDVKSVAPVANAQVTATYQGATYSPGQFVGSTPAYESIRNYQIQSGRFFDSADENAHARVVVLGQTVVTNLFGQGADPVGANVNVNGTSFQVIGVLKSKGTNGLQDQDDVAIAPLTAVEDNLTGNTGNVNQIAIEANSANVMNAAQSEITSTLESTHKVTDPTNPGFQVLNQASLLSTSNQTNHVLTVLLGAVAAISLLVGGIGVMNIMLVSVTERTREIGIRKAVGARRGDILVQFLVEAMLLSVLGGILGVIAGLVGSQFKIVGVQPLVQAYSVVLAFGVALAVGLFFGIYPASRAARLRPIEALRYE